MNTSFQQQPTVTFREPSQKQLRKYFTAGRFNGVIRGLIPFGCGLLLTALGLIRQNLLFAYLGLFICLVVVVIVISVLRARISDEDYDAWLEQKARDMRRDAFSILRIDRNALVCPVLTIHSFVLPGSTFANDYADGTVLMKLGKDGNWRYSVNVYTFIFHLGSHIAIYSQDINAVDMSTRSWQNEEYASHHIVTANAVISPDDVFIENEWRRCDMYQAGLMISTQNILALGAYIKVSPIGNRDLPVYLLPDSDVSQTVISLRQLLRSTGRRRP